MTKLRISKERVKKMYKEIFVWRVLEELKKGKSVFALDTKKNMVFDLESQTIKSILFLLDVAEKHENRIIFYYWEEEV